MTTGGHVICVGFHAAEAHAVDFDLHTVTAVMSRGSAARLPAEVAGRFARIAPLDLDSRDLDAYDRASGRICELARELAGEFGPPAGVIGLYEHTTLPAARLREHLGVGGTSPRTARLCRDKVGMKRVLAQAGVRVPRFLPLGPDTPREDLARFARQVPGRIVVKPRSQAASLGVRILEGAGELLALAEAGGIGERYEAEEFVEGSVFHLDGVVRDGVVRWLCPSRYVTTAFAFQHERKPMISVVLDDRALATRMFTFAETVLRTLGLTDSVFHLELFHTPDDEIVFLEIGNRFGGAGVPVHHRTSYGVDLPREAVLACTGGPSELAGPAETHRHPGLPASGWMFVPLDEARRCRVVEVRGLGDLPGSVAWSAVPAVGDVLDGSSDVWNTAGRFVVLGESAAAVENDMKKIAATYSVSVTGD
ncbi:ATP-grasp domain-containing protein [Microbispora sp. H10670]|uniref:ATP-grasp domain-containing protein n=1 Tax=Microbispora sp. H10670 TaxID=2729108 RepID=UPI00160304D8|nr:hypothetical protein [Microbispora sp. H10670]